MNEERESVGYGVDEPKSSEALGLPGAGKTETGSQVSSGDSQIQNGNGREDFKGAVVSSNSPEDIQAQVPKSYSALNASDKERIAQEYLDQAIPQGIIGVNSVKIARLYPKAHQAVVQAMNTASGMELDETTVMSVFLYSPRSVLPEFFDAQKVWLNISGSEDKWVNNLDSVGNYPNRILAEVAGYEKAFEITNNKL